MNLGPSKADRCVACASASNIAQLQRKFSDEFRAGWPRGIAPRGHPARNSSGEMLVPEGALGFLATENISFQVEGLATCEQITPALRDPAAAPVP